MDDAVVGIDIGATKTHLALGTTAIGTASAIVDERIVRTKAWRIPESAANAATLAGLVSDAFGAAALRLPLAVGAHGCDNTDQCLRFQAQLGEHFGGPVRVVNDAELMPPAMGVPGGIGVVCGTGSIAAVRDEADQLITSGGWGWVLGDEGSASGLVREAVRAVLTELDLGHPPDQLATRLMASFQAPTGPELAMSLSRSNSADYWGSHATEVFAAMADGSEVAAAVIRDGGRQLATVVQRLLARGIPITSVVAGGAVIATQPLLRDSFLTTLKELCPRVDARVLDRPPVIGALAIASGLPVPTAS
ncbi:N-acetylglucosamine kinase [Fodinicola feengrottensis]|uniref:BadF/BadG/BcrA/BcrD ATPase family protein n=1 Tax=Fodinicola feengrottensis TaxID=435914 RepID=A0ABN2I125_9ACTN|nr:BadF/BadG/BcrA/BcrD ATPase family protein [Fodinicola feengrottensis]